MKEDRTKREHIQSGFLRMWTIIMFMMLTLADGRRNKGEHKYETPTPVFLPTESNYTYHKGERAILYCSVQNLGTKWITWRRVNDSALLTIGSIAYAADKRYEIGHIEDSQDWNLMISNVTTADTGAYECQISAVDRDLRKEMYLHVKDEFSYAEPHIRITGTLHVDRGTELKLICNATGAITPPDYIDWFKDGSKIVANKRHAVELRKKLSINFKTISSVYTKSQADMTDTGTYVCRTSDLQVTSVKVNVLNSDKISRKREPTDKENLEMGPASNSSSSNSRTISVMLIALTQIIYCIYQLNFKYER